MNDVNEFLAHYGFKGMKWGVRKEYYGKAYKNATKRRAAKKLKKYGPKDRKKRTLKQKQNRIDRLNIRVSAGVMAISAASYISALIIENKARDRAWNQQQRQEDEFFKNWKTYKPSKPVNDLINQERKTKVDAIDKTFREGFIDKDQRDKFIESMNKRYDRKVADALKNK